MRGPGSTGSGRSGGRTDATGALAFTMPPRPGDVRRFAHEAMATVFEVYAVHADAGYAAQAAQAAFDLVDRLERELSRFVPNSDIARVNDLRAGERTAVAPTTLECLVIARHVFELTGGAFDPSIGTGLTSLELDADEVSVRAERGGVRLDLGAIGKGYAVDLMAEVLEEWGLDQAVVHGGFSSMLALNAPAGADGWPLTLSDPRSSSRVLARLSVCQAALGASGLRKGEHIIDPRTGIPARGRLAAWVVVPRPPAASTDLPAPAGQDLSPSAPAGQASSGEAPAGPARLAACAVTDALTTAFMLLGLEEIEALCSATPGLEAWLLADDGRFSHVGA
jgi:thiamine biosynthesis lipoprotein